MSSTSKVCTKADGRETVKLFITEQPGDEDWTTMSRSFVLRRKTSAPLSVNGEAVATSDDPGRVQRKVRMAWRPSGAKSYRARRQIRGASA